MPDLTVVEKAARAGSLDEGDVKVVLPQGAPRFTIEVKYRTSRPTKSAIGLYRYKALVEARHYGSDLALLVLNSPGLSVPHWAVHFRPLSVADDDPRWLVGEVSVWLPRLLTATATTDMEGMFR